MFAIEIHFRCDIKIALRCARHPWQLLRRTERSMLRNRLTNQTITFARCHAITQNSGLQGEYQPETARVKPEFPTLGDIFPIQAVRWASG